jgi:hypothetical protein
MRLSSKRSKLITRCLRAKLKDFFRKKVNSLKCSVLDRPLLFLGLNSRFKSLFTAIFEKYKYQENLLSHLKKTFIAGCFYLQLKVKEEISGLLKGPLHGGRKREN